MTGVQWTSWRSAEHLSSRGLDEHWRKRGLRRGLAIEALPDLQRVDRLQHRLGVAGDLDLMPDSADHARAVDDEGGAVDAHVLAAVEALLDPRAIGVDGLALGIGRQLDL